jgi:NAD(P)-dependent dehydrogenase (short-subunit alcohol dehydrogenase family)
MGILDGKVAVVTGGARGIGRAYCLGLAREGAAVISADLADSSETVAAVHSDGGQADQIETDVSDKESAERMASFTAERFGKIDILINNAGINIRGPIEELTFEQFQQVQEINVNGVWRCAKAVIPHMKQAKYGRIINMASTLGVVGLANRTPYASSKGAVVQMTRALGLELAPHGKVLYSSDAYLANPGVNVGLATWYQAHNSTGLLPNDRTHVFKLVTTYQVKRSLAAGAFFTWQSGTPLTEFGSGPLTFPRFLSPRGSVGRTPAITDLNLRLAYDVPTPRGPARRANRRARPPARPPPAQPRPGRRGRRRRRPAGRRR